MVNLKPHSLYSRKRHPVPFDLEAVWASDPVTTISRSEKYYVLPKFEPRIFQTLA
jgi:hypothetical protein